jgi:hypothetical protein
VVEMVNIFWHSTKFHQTISTLASFTVFVPWRL